MTVITMPSPAMLKAIIAAAAIAAVLLGVYLRGRHDVQVLWDLDKSATALVVEQIKADNTKRESALRESIAVERANLREGIQNAENSYRVTVDDLRNGNTRLRKSFATCADTVSAIAADTAGVPDRPAGGFNDQDAAVAFRITADGERGIVERNACVAILRSERK